MDSIVIFYPMSQIPLPDESDASFSKTVIVYSEKFSIIGMGYFDFEEEQWSHFGDNLFLLKCWCYVPNPKATIEYEIWPVITPKGYKKNRF